MIKFAVYSLKGGVGKTITTATLAHMYATRRSPRMPGTAKASLRRTLAMDYPEVVFINPLDTMRHLECSELSYEQILEQCKALLLMCDAVFMAGRWTSSFGCRAERQCAIDAGIPVFEDLRNLEAFLRK